jgi:hypothetical protein
MTPQETTPTNEYGELEVAVRGIVSVANRLALRVIVLESALAELISAQSPLEGQEFAKDFKTRIANLMQRHVDRLLPFDDAELALAADNILKCVNRT